LASTDLVGGPSTVRLTPSETSINSMLLKGF
jgi:hypothetical protein